MANYAILGIYRAPADILRADVRACVSDGHWCYLQLIERRAQDTYVAYVASSRQTLERSRDIEDAAIVITVTSAQLERASLEAKPSAQAHYVAPERVLPDYLRVHASAAGLCYFETTGPCEANDHQPVRVVALQERLSNPQTRSFHTVFGPEELAQAVLYTHELQSLPTCDLRLLVEDYADRKLLLSRLNDPLATSFFNAFGHTTAEQAELLASEVHSLPMGARTSLVEDYTGKAALRAARAHTAVTPPDEESRWCQLDQCLPVAEAPEAVEKIEEDEEIEPVFVSKRTIKTVPTRGLPKHKFTHTWWQKLVLRSALCEINSQLKKRKLDTPTREMLEQKDWALRSVLVKGASRDRRVHIVPVSANSRRISGYQVHLYRRAGQPATKRSA